MRLQDQPTGLSKYARKKRGLAEGTRRPFFDKPEKVILEGSVTRIEQKGVVLSVDTGQEYWFAFQEINQFFPRRRISIGDKICFSVQGRMQRLIESQ